MKIDIDKDADTAYIYMKKEIGKGEVAKTIEVNNNLILDFDKDGRLLGIEVLNANKTLSEELLRTAHNLV